MSDHALKPWHCTPSGSIFAHITKLYNAQECAPTFADFIIVCSSCALNGLKSIQMQSFHSAQQGWRAKLPTHSVSAPSRGSLVPQKLFQEKTKQTTKPTYLKQCWKHTGTPTFSFNASSHFFLLCPPMFPTFSNSVLFTSDFAKNPQPTRAGNTTQKTYMGWERDRFLVPVTRSPVTRNLSLSL